MVRKSQVKVKKEKPTPTKSKSKGMVVTPYVNGITERVQRVFKKYCVDVAMKPYSTLRNLLVHPKDKREKHQCSNCIYEISCNNCDQTYVGLFGIRLAEHQAEVKKAIERKFKRSERRASEQEQTKSAISDRENHASTGMTLRSLAKNMKKSTRDT